MFTTQYVNAQEQKKGKGKALAMSAIYPGSGVYSLNKSKKGALLLGVASYATAAASYLTYKNAVSNYDKYIEETNDALKRKDYADEWELQLFKSKLFAGTSAGIWVGSMIYTAFTKSKKAPYSFRINKRFPLNFGCIYNPYIKSPQVSLRLSF